MTIATSGPRVASKVERSFSEISAAALRKRLLGKEELAVIDVRDGGVHSRDGHILLSVSLPLSHLE